MALGESNSFLESEKCEGNSSQFSGFMKYNRSL